MPRHPNIAATAIIAALIARSPAAQATIYYVSISGNDGNAGTSWSTAWRHVEYALAQASAFDYVKVAQGTYSPGTNATDTFTMTSRVTLEGGYYGDDVERKRDRFD